MGAGESPLPRTLPIGILVLWRQLNPQPQSENAGAPYAPRPARSDPGLPGLPRPIHVIEWGKVNYTGTENGGHIRHRCS